METIIGSVITGVLALIGVMISNMANNRKVEEQLRTAQAVTDVKIENLTEEVRKHNSFGDRIITLENRAREHDDRFDRMEARMTRYEART